MKKRIPITVVFHLEMTFEDDTDAELIRFMVEENHCLDNHIAKLTFCSDSQPGVCFGCEVGEAYVGHLPLDALRTIVEREGGDKLDRAVQAIGLARVRGLDSRDESEPYLCECGAPAAEIRWAESALGPGIETVRVDGTVCCVSQIGEYPTAETAQGRLEVLRHHARTERVRESK